MNAEKSCREVRLELYPFLKGELESVEKSAVQEHLDACKSCDQEMNEMRASLENLSALDVVLIPSENGWERLAQRIENHRLASAAWRTARSWS